MVYKLINKLSWFALTVVITLCDYLTKSEVILNLMPYQPKPLLTMLSFMLAYNTGSAFGFLHRAGEWHRWFFAYASKHKK